MTQFMDSIISAVNDLREHFTQIQPHILVIDITNADSTPSGERVGINYDTDRPHAGLDDFMFRTFSEFKPFLERSGQISIAAKDFYHASVVIAPIPNNRSHDNA